MAAAAWGSVAGDMFFAHAAVRAQAAGPQTGYVEFAQMREDADLKCEDFLDYGPLYEYDIALQDAPPPHVVLAGDQELRYYVPRRCVPTEAPL